METISIQRKEIANKQVQIIDSAIRPDEVVEFYKFINELSYKKKEFDDDGDEYPIFSVDFQPSRFQEETAIGKKGAELLEQLRGQEYILNRAYVNMCHYGDVEYPHRDCGIGETDVTVLYYANKAWDYTWGGETKFYDNKDTTFCVLPKPGRFVIFDGAVEHMGSIPTRICKVSRYTVAMKFKRAI